MNTWIAQSGEIETGPGLGILIKSIQIDVNNQSADDVYVTLSGAYGRNTSTFTAIVPIVGDFRYELEENVHVLTSDVGSTQDINNVIINYVHYGDQTIYMQADPTRIPTPPPESQWSRPSGY